MSTPGPHPQGGPAGPGPDPSGQGAPGPYPWSQAGPGPYPPAGAAAPGPYGSPGPSPAKPSSVRLAVALMWVGAALSVIGLLTTFAMQDELREMMDQQLASQGTPVTPELVEVTVTATLAIAVVSGLVGTALWILNAVYCSRGAVWSRILATVLGGVYLVNALFSLTQPSPAVSKLLIVLNMAVSLGAIVFLWLKPSSDWFRAVRGPVAPAGYGPPPRRS